MVEWVMRTEVMYGLPVSSLASIYPIPIKNGTDARDGKTELFVFALLCILI